MTKQDNSTLLGKPVHITTTYGGNYSGKDGIVKSIQKDGMFAGWLRVEFTPSFEIDGHIYTDDVFLPKELTVITEA
jgi:hypothetical protein